MDRHARKSAHSSRARNLNAGAGVCDFLREFGRSDVRGQRQGGPGVVPSRDAGRAGDAEATEGATP